MVLNNHSSVCVLKWKDPTHNGAKFQYHREPGQEFTKAYKKDFDGLLISPSYFPYYIKGNPNSVKLIYWTRTFLELAEQLHKEINKTEMRL